MFIHNIDPILLNLGFLQIRYYSLVFIIGFIITYYLLRYYIKKGEIENFNLEKLDTYLVYIILGVIIGARIGYFFTKHPDPFGNPLDIVKVWQGGLSFHGGLLGALASTYLFTKKYKIKFYDLADILVLPAAFSLFLGRIANFINGELVGTITTSKYCIQYQNYEGCRYPSQLYESGKNLFIFIILIITKKKNLQPGTLFWLFILLYGILRFLITFYRDDPNILLNLSGGQINSLIMFIIASIILIRRNKSTDTIK